MTELATFKYNSQNSRHFIRIGSLWPLAANSSTKPLDVLRDCIRSRISSLNMIRSTIKEMMEDSGSEKKVLRRDGEAHYGQANGDVTVLNQSQSQVSTTGGILQHNNKEPKRLPPL